MIKSMTGFASAAATAENIAVTVEMRTYNSRNLDLSLRVSPGDPGLEERIRALLAGRLVRGRVEVKIQVETTVDDAARVEVDMARARALMAVLKRLKFASKSEAYTAEQKSLIEETLDADLAALAAEIEIHQPTKPAPEDKQSPKREPLPPHLPRRDVHHEPESTACACGRTRCWSTATACRRWRCRRRPSSRETPRCRPSPPPPSWPRPAGMP